MKNSLKVAIGFLCLLTLTNCNDFLSVQPRNQLLESQVFSSETDIQGALNGVYIGMAQNSLYGGNLTMSTIELLAQRYNEDSNTMKWYDYANYNYGEKEVKNTMEDIWSSAYKLVLNLNVFVENLDKTQGVITQKREKLLKGEAIGLRAFLQFDMLRLFGPIYSVNPGGSAIPYYTKADVQANEILPADVVIKDVLDDLKAAEKLLSNDPIITKGIQHITKKDGNDFYRWRNYHMNYYAVKALEARVYLYAGDSTKALNAAKAVIKAQKNKGLFPWVDPDDVITAPQNPDRVFSSEVIFGIRNLNLYNQQKALFSTSLNGTNILAPNPGRLAAIYNSNQNDYRYKTWWNISATGRYSFRTFFKFADVVNKDLDFRYLQPLIRISEMYYIAAETEPDPSAALKYLNTVRFHRGLPDLPATVNLQQEIRKAYIKEFYGEGQLFFYYKRVDAKTIPNGSTLSGTIDMGPSKYVVPLPESETKYSN